MVSLLRTCNYNCTKCKMRFTKRTPFRLKNDATFVQKMTTQLLRKVPWWRLFWNKQFFFLFLSSVIGIRFLQWYWMITRRKITLTSSSPPTRIFVKMSICCCCAAMVLSRYAALPVCEPKLALFISVVE